MQSLVNAYRAAVVDPGILADEPDLIPSTLENVRGPLQRPSS